MSRLRIKDFQNPHIIRSIIFLKVLENLIVFTIGVLQFIIGYSPAPTTSSTSSSNSTTSTKTTTTQPNIDDVQTNVMKIVYVYVVVFLIFMINAFYILYDQFGINKLIYKSLECNVCSCVEKCQDDSDLCNFCCCCCNLCICCWTCTTFCCLYFDLFKSVFPFLFQCLSIRECFWRVHTKFMITISYILRLSIYLFGFSISVACFSISTTQNSNLYGWQAVCIANMVLHIFRIFIMTFLFAYCSMFNPKHALKDPENTIKLQDNFFGFLRLEEIGTSSCSSNLFNTDQCAVTDLAHVLRCHEKIHVPLKIKIDPKKKCILYCSYFNCYELTGRKNFYIGFHQTTPEVSLLIAKNGFECGTSGNFGIYKYFVFKIRIIIKIIMNITHIGGGIYFARNIDLTDRKALSNGAVVCALIDMGEM